MDLKEFVLNKDVINNKRYTMKNKAIRLNCDTKTVYYVELDISTYDKKVESIKKELNTNSLALQYLPNGEIVFADEEHPSFEIVEKESNIFLGNAIIASNIVEDVDYPIEFIKELLLPNVYQFSDEIQKNLDKEMEIARTIEDNVKYFRPTTKEEIESFNLLNGEQCEIEVLDYCPFALISDRYITKATVRNEMRIEDSNFEFYFSYDNSYGLESFCSFEKARIIKKIMFEENQKNI